MTLISESCYSIDMPLVNTVLSNVQVTEILFFHATEIKIYLIIAELSFPPSRYEKVRDNISYSFDEIKSVRLKDLFNTGNSRTVILSFRHDTKGLGI